MLVSFVTSNSKKFSEAEAVLSPEVRLEQLNFSLDEPRGSLEEIAMTKALEAYRRFKRPLFVEDAGLFIEALDGFPGAYSAWVLEHLSLEDVVSLVDRRASKGASRKAHFKAVVAYVDERGIKLFKGTVEGTISNTIRGKGGFGYDPIFIPEGYEETFAENEGLKRNMSHRYRALIELKHFLLKDSPS